MREAEKKTITPPARPAVTHDTPPLAVIDNDAVLLALAERYRETWGASVALGEQRPRWSGEVNADLSTAAAVAESRADAILFAICAIPARGLPGALAQLEAACVCADRIAAVEEPSEEDRAAMGWAFWSIARVLRGQTATEAVLVNELVPYNDPFEMQHAAIIARRERQPAGGHQPRRRRTGAAAQ